MSNIESNSSNIESVSFSTLSHAGSRARRSRTPSPFPSLLALLGSVLLAAAGCGDDSDLDGEQVDAGALDAAPADATLPDAEPPDAGLQDALSGPATPVYFLVAELPGEVEYNDSYVLPLTRADQIEHARDLIERGPEAAGTHIVVATMRAGADGINRNLRAEGAPEWSWHVTEMVTFADATMEILDGWPSFIEEDVSGWIANTCFGDETMSEGTVGFWGYTIVEELEDYPMSLP